jgi:hypothetical protein
MVDPGGVGPKRASVDLYRGIHRQATQNRAVRGVTKSVLTGRRNSSGIWAQPSAPGLESHVEVVLAHAPSSRGCGRSSGSRLRHAADESRITSVTCRSYQRFDPGREGCNHDYAATVREDDLHLIPLRFFVQFGV